MKFYKNGKLVSSYEASYSNRKIVIAIDSSKSNTAIVVGDIHKNVYDDYEISGAGSDTDVYDLCKATRQQLKELFRNADIIGIGIEDIITKKPKNGKTSGLDIHKSRHAITAVFDNFMIFFEDFCGIRPDRINNWAWKTDILPEEFRKREYDKGSKEWFARLGNRWCDRKDDVTDAVCIYWHMCNKFKYHLTYDISYTKPCDRQYDYIIVPKTYTPPSNSKEFFIKNDDSLIHNINTIAMSIEKGTFGIVKVPISLIDIDLIYSGKLRTPANHSFERFTDEAMIIVSVE